MSCKVDVKVNSITVLTREVVSDLVGVHELKQDLDSYEGVVLHQVWQGSWGQAKLVGKLRVPLKLSPQLGLLADAEGILACKLHQNQVCSLVK